MVCMAIMVIKARVASTALMVAMMAEMVRAAKMVRKAKMAMLKVMTVLFLSQAAYSNRYRT